MTRKEVLTGFFGFFFLVFVLFLYENMDTHQKPSNNIYKMSIYYVDKDK